MKLIQLIIRNLLHFRNEHLLLMAGLVLSTAILTSALITGDSVQNSLQTNIDVRLGKTSHVLLTQEKFFPARFARTISSYLKAPVAPVLLLRGVASSDQTEEKVTNLKIYGIDEQFIRFGNGIMPETDDNTVIINQQLAVRLNLKTGDEIMLRIEKPGFISSNVPFVSTENNKIAIRLKVKAIVDKQNFGNFNIETNQITPYSVFIPIEKLSLLSFDDVYANLLLIDSPTKQNAEIDYAIRNCWTPDVINMKIREVENQKELISDAVFIPDTIINLLKNNQLNTQPHYTYLVNNIRKKDKETPYSFVSGLSAYPDFQLRDNEIALNSWLAEDLNAGLNDTLWLRYYTLKSFRKLKEDSVKMVVKKIIEIRDFAADSMLMPAFEGLSEATHCSDWKAGIPVDFSKIRDKDEKWWEKYKGTPKAFVSYSFATKYWGNDFGNATAVRFSEDTDSAKIATTLLTGLSPAGMGLIVHDIRNQAGWSAKNAVDFAQLFLALSFFLIIAAFLLSGLFFSMMLSQRSKEQGILLSTGISQKTIFRIFFIEGLIITLISSIIGVFAGMGFSKLIIYFLNTAWNEIVRTDTIGFYFNTTSLLYGFLGNMILCSILIYFILKKQFKKQIHAITQNQSPTNTISKSRKKLNIVAISSFILFIILMIYNFTGDDYQNSSVFFLGGFLLLTGLISIIGHGFLFFSIKQINSLTIINLALRNLGFHYKRNILISSILAIGVFIVLSTGANRVDFTRNANNNSSGTGGFIYYIETGLPVHADLQTTSGREEVGISDEIKETTFIQFLQYKNDDASCLNLNKIVRPTILGVRPGLLANRNSFFFINTKENTPEGWSVLNMHLAENCIPAVADQTVITWGLGKNIGDSIAYTNEKGQLLYLILVGGIESSVLQGNILISEENFIRHFPSVSGSNIILADAEPNQSEALKENLQEAFNQYGADIQHATERLDTFNSVTNTYLDIFMALGIIALLIGTIGIAIVIVKSIRSEKQQLAMLQALGIKRRDIISINVLSYTFLLISGIVAGAISTFFAVFPGLMNANAPVPLILLIVIISCILLNGIVWIIAGTKLSISKRFLADIRGE